MCSIKLSISIVLYNENFSDIKNCLESLIHSIPEAVRYEIFLVDNGALELNKVSDIETNCLCHFSGSSIHYVLSPKNGGYGYGHNQAIFSSNADYHLVINSDVYMLPEAFKKCISIYAC